MTSSSRRVTALPLRQFPSNALRTLKTVLISASDGETRLRAAALFSESFVYLYRPLQDVMHNPHRSTIQVTKKHPE